MKRAFLLTKKILIKVVIIYWANDAVHIWETLIDNMILEEIVIKKDYFFWSIAEENLTKNKNISVDELQEN